MLASLLVAVVVTGFEAVSLRGADNLFVPIAACVILGKITAKPVEEIVFQNVSLIALCTVIGVGARHFPGLNVGATIAVTLFTYGLWSLGSPVWALPVLIALVAIVTARTEPFSGRAIGVRPVVRAIVPLFAILIIANTYDAVDFWYAPYLGAVAAMTAIGVVHTGGQCTRSRLLSLGACAAIVLIPAGLVVSAPASSLVALVAVAVLGGASALALRARYPSAARLGNAIPALVAIGAAGIVALLEYQRTIPPWIIGFGFLTRH